MCLALGLAGAIMLCGCHSACFQTAKITDGIDATLGVTAVHSADDADASDYSIFVRGSIGRGATRQRYGYSFALTLVSPFKSDSLVAGGADDSEDGTFPNGTAGIMPEFKFQFHRTLPVDIAVYGRLMGIYPERIGALVSRDLSKRVTIYGGYFLNARAGQLATGGGEVSLTQRISLLAEYSAWLSEHRYPESYEGPARKYPFSFGLALSYRLPRKAEPYDARPYAMQTRP
jgi:hypothetical protein